VPDVGHAISLAASDDTIMIAAATYSEHLTISISLSLVGSSAGATIIDGGGHRHGRIGVKWQQSRAVGVDDPKRVARHLQRWDLTDKQQHHPEQLPSPILHQRMPFRYRFYRFELDRLAGDFRQTRN
jgi:hypothetical protein